MKKISLLPLLFSLSFSVAWGAQTQGANEQDKANSPQIETQNKDTYTPLPNPIKDMILHYGYFFSTVIVESLLSFGIHIIAISNELNDYYLSIQLSAGFVVSLLISAGIPYFSEDIGKVDHYSNPLPFGKGMLRVFSFLFIPFFIQFFLIYYHEVGDIIVNFINKNSNYYLGKKAKWIISGIISPILLNSICFLIAWCIDRFIFSSSETDKKNEKNYIA